MTHLELFVFSSFTILIFILKTLHDRYSASKSLLDAFVEELENLNTLKDRYQQELSNLAEELDEKNETEFNLKIHQEKLNSEINKLKDKITLLISDINAKDVEHQINLDEAIAAARKDALKRSRSVIRGQASEHLAPFVIKDTNPKDYRFMGNPIDYICFNGLSDVLDGKSDAITSVDFVDIKTGKSSLNKSQRRIRDAINNNKVTFKVINLDEVLNDNKVKDGTQVESPTKS